jgi:hypothetical protein
LQVNEPDIPAQTLVGVATGTSGVLTVAYPKNFCGVIQADMFVGPAPWRLIVGHQQMIQTGVLQNGGCCPPTSAATAQSAQPAVAPSTPQSASTAQSARSTPRRGRLGHATTPVSHHARTGHHATRATTGTTSTTTTTTQAATPSTPQATTQDVTCEPITGAVNTVPAASQLPFTGEVSTVPATATAQATLPFTGLEVKPLAIAGMALILLGLGIGTTHQQRRRALARAGYYVRTSRGAAYTTRAGRWFVGE